MHSHLCLQACSPKEEVSVLIEDQEITVFPDHVLLINRNVTHQLNRATWTNILIDPESQYCNEFETLLNNHSYKLYDDLSLLNNIHQSLSLQSQNLRPEIQNAIKIIRDHNHNCNLEEIASSVFLSAERFRHIFKEELGITFKNYIKWQKIKKAFSLTMTDNELNLTEIAYQSGFSDQAHMSRVIKENFGYTPKTLTKKISR